MDHLQKNYEEIAVHLIRGTIRVPIDLISVARSVADQCQAPVKVSEIPMLPYVEGVVSLESGIYFVAVNSRHHLTRRRTTLAHELSEIVLGQVRRTTINKLILQPNRKKEARAFRLARAILVPRWFVDASVQIYKNEPPRIITLITECCKVSMDLACLRVKDLYPEYSFSLSYLGKVVFEYGEDGECGVKTDLNMGKYTLTGQRRIL